MRRVQSTSQTEGGGASSGIQCSASGVQDVQRPAPLAQNRIEDLCRTSGIPCTFLSEVGDKRDDPGVIEAPGIGTGLREFPRWKHAICVTCEDK